VYERKFILNFSDSVFPTQAILRIRGLRRKRAEKGGRRRGEEYEGCHRKTGGGENPVSEC
jgi:hypothetical protein